VPKVDGMMEFSHLILSINQYNKFFRTGSLLTLNYSKDQENSPSVEIASLNYAQQLHATNHYLHIYLTT
jgi:hypothetical protein